MEKNVCGLENIYNKEVWELFKECFKNKKRSKPYISYSDWKVYHFEQLERIKRMTDKDVKVVCGVNPNLLSPDYKEEEEIIESMKDWGKRTYTKDEGEVSFTLEGLYKMWKVIEKEKKKIFVTWDYGTEGNDYNCMVCGYYDKKGNIVIDSVDFNKNNKKEKGMKILILEGLYGWNKGRKCQWRLKRTNLKVGDKVLLDNIDWKVIKVIEQKRKNIKALIYNLTTREVYKTKISGRLKEGEEFGYIKNGRWFNCVVIKIVEAKKKKKKKEKLDPFIEKRRFKDGLRGTNPKGAVFSEFAKKPTWGPDFNEINKILESLKTHDREIMQAKKEQAEKIEKIILKRKLKEFRKRPYFTERLNGQVRYRNPKRRAKTLERSRGIYKSKGVRLCQKIRQYIK